MHARKRPPAQTPAGGKPPGPVQDLTIAALEAELEGLRGQVAKLTEIAARAQADLQNARARVERDALELRAFAAEGVIGRLLPTIDNFQRAFQHLPEDLGDHEWVKGVQAIEQELLRNLGDLGLKKFSPLGQKIDPTRHEVVLTGSGEAETVIDVLADGYELNGRVLRPAKVKVGDGRTEGTVPTPGAPGAG